MAGIDSRRSLSHPPCSAFFAGDALCRAAGVDTVRAGIRGPTSHSRSKTEWAGRGSARGGHSGWTPGFSRGAAYFMRSTRRRYLGIEAVWPRPICTLKLVFVAK